MSEVYLDVLVVDDEPAARRYLGSLLAEVPSIRSADSAEDAAAALRELHSKHYEVVFLDVRMPGLDGMDLARVLNRFERPPMIVFVTAYEEHAVDAFGVRAFDYLLKPVDPRRLDDTVRRLVDHVSRATSDAPSQQGRPERPTATPVMSTTVESIPGDSPRPLPALDPAPATGSATSFAVDQGGRTVMIERASVTYVEAAKDYCRLRTADGAYLLRLPISTLEAAWCDFGWLRIHRSYLVPIDVVSELRQDPERGWLVRLGRIELPVSRRHLPTVRDRLHRSARALRKPEL